MDFTIVALMATGAAGALGWFFAWRGRGELIAAHKEIEEDQAFLAAANTLAFAGNSKAAAAGAALAVAQARTDALAVELDAERKSRQSLIDALAKSGAPVGDAVVDNAMDRLYSNGDQGGPGPDTGSGGH